MNWFRRKFDLIKRFNSPLESWYRVTFDDDSISISAEPPGGEAWSHTIPWEEIVALMFPGRGGLESDDVYIWTGLEE